jgi:hypothetical protein
MGGRKERFTIRAADAKVTKAENKVTKNAERKRRDARMIAAIKKGSLPYAPVVMSWLSRELDKPSTKITAADVKTVVR